MNSNNEVKEVVSYGFISMPRGKLLLVILIWATGIIQFIGPMRTVIIAGLALSGWFFLTACIILPLATIAYLVATKHHQ
ncbi:MAG: hypothetical protein RBS51_00795 [Anaerovoracaceae bacterium]|jgi:hypothetical protein|nr:hypothetical protein [Anaerovoracaceae bacterium]